MSEKLPVYVSASQIETFNQCARKWGFDKLDRIERADSAGARESSALHAECEAHHLDGSVPTSGAARVALRLAPPPSSTVVVEQGFEWPLPGSNIIFTGFIDLLDLSDPKHPRIWDYKFYKDKKYFRGAEDLRSDIQRITYTHVLFQEFPEAEKVSFGLIQVAKTGTHAACLVDFPSTRDEARIHFERVSSLAYAIAGHRELTSSARDIDFPPTDTPCVAYGGCHYIKVCGGAPSAPFNAESFVSNLFAEDVQDMSFMKNLKASRPAPATPAAAPAATPAAAPAAATKPRFQVPAPKAPPPPPEPVAEEPAPEPEPEPEAAAAEVVEEEAPRRRGGRPAGSKDRKPRNTYAKKQTLLLMEIRDLIKHALVASELLEDGTDTAADPSELGDEDGDE